ncbi:peptidase [bacterium]|nr:peptidase [bacterium]
MGKRKFCVLTLMILGVFIMTLAFNFSCKTKKEKEEEIGTIAGYEVVPDIEERLAQYAPTEITYDENLLNEEQKKVLEKLVMAAQKVDPIFWKQASRRGLEFRDAFKEASHPRAGDYLHYLNINFGPYDRLAENEPFIGTQPKPPGAGFYPPDLTQGGFQGYIDGHPQKKEALESHYTVVKRENDSLIPVPYNEEYRKDLEPIAGYLKEAAQITSNSSLEQYLNQRAVDLLQNDYYRSDCLWIDLEDNLVEIVIGPFEVYEDKLMGLKAAYESFVYINDFEEMRKIEGYLDYLGIMQENLPVEEKYKEPEVVGLESPLNVVNEVYVAGDTKAGVQTLAFVLPNDEKVRQEKGTKKVFLKNIMEAKFEKILVPISQKILTEEDSGFVSFYAYFTQVILHEISHALGVNYVMFPDGSRTPVNKALKEHYSPIEECKADIVGLYNVPLLMDEGWIPEEKEKDIYSTYLAGMFRSLRFGAHEAHGLATLIQLNFHLENGAFLYNEETGKYRVDMDKIKDSVEQLAQKVLILEGDGDYEKAGEFLSKYGTLSDEVKQTLSRLEDIPVDIEPVFQQD